MDNNFSRIIQYIINPEILEKLNSSTNIVDELNLDYQSESFIARKINAAFLLLLVGESGEDYKKANDIFTHHKNHPEWEMVIRFYETGLKEIESEISTKASNNSKFYLKLQDLARNISNSNIIQNSNELLNKINELFFPESAGLDQTDIRNDAVQNLRKKRAVKITELNPEPITDPTKQILFTSNILATVPLEDSNLDELDLSTKFQDSLKNILNEKQRYWYDHPIPLGIAPEKNEAIYGLRGLDDMVEFEKSTGRIPAESKLTCLLSASTTHDGLHAVVKEYFEDEFKKYGRFINLDILIFTEADTDIITEKILVPLNDRYLSVSNKEILFDIFGVDGEYGRHYSFLKAITAFWQVFIDPEIKATFKIDLDQVFPQEKLITESGSSAMDHFKTSLWGAKGIDSSGNEVELSLIAGSLVNQKDIDKSIFTPDVTFPEEFISSPESLIFHSKIPQALSTEAEMMMRYDEDQEMEQAIQRIHVTGGTNGILIEALRKYRPFTPSIIGRAEDQAYLLSVLFKNNPVLRYLHKPGLIMRHDKHAFASEAIDAAAAGKLIGDYIRILIFSSYARVLPWDFEKIKSEFDPFTGSFVSQIPVTIVMLRFALKMIELSEKGDAESLLNFLKLGSHRIYEWLNRLSTDDDYFKYVYEKELEGWNTYYDLLDLAEEKLNQNDEFIIELKNKVQVIVEHCRVKFE